MNNETFSSYKPLRQLFSVKHTFKQIVFLTWYLFIRSLSNASICSPMTFNAELRFIIADTNSVLYSLADKWLTILSKSCCTSWTKRIYGINSILAGKWCSGLFDIYLIFYSLITLHNNIICSWIDWVMLWRAIFFGVVISLWYHLFWWVIETYFRWAF